MASLDGSVSIPISTPLLQGLWWAATKGCSTGLWLLFRAHHIIRRRSFSAGIRPGKNTADFITDTLARMSVLGSAFLGVLAAAPAAVEQATGLQVT